MTYQWLAVRPTKSKTGKNYTSTDRSNEDWALASGKQWTRKFRAGSKVKELRVEEIPGRDLPEQGLE